MEAAELAGVLDAHAKWLRLEQDGKRANLRDANLRNADLREAHLSDANLSDANLSDTCLDPSRAIPEIDDVHLVAAGLEPRSDGYVYGWRTARSQHHGDTEYTPGQTYEAPIFSVANTPCHPGVYLAGAARLAEAYPREPIVRVRCRREDIHAAAGGKFRARRIEVL